MLSSVSSVNLVFVYPIILIPASAKPSLTLIELCYICVGEEAKRVISKHDAGALLGMATVPALNGLPLTYNGAVQLGGLHRRTALKMQ